MLDDADNMLPHVRFAAEEQAKYRDSVGIIAPFELICLPCSSQGVRVIIPPGGVCARCYTGLGLQQQSQFSARPEREPIGCWCLGGLAGERSPTYARRPSWVEQAARRCLFGDVWLDLPHQLEISH
jgi:hypothetical protein